MAFSTGAFIIQGGTTFNYNPGSTVGGTGAFTNNSTLQLNTDVVFPAPLVFTSTNTINGPGNLTINNDFTIQGQITGPGILTINANSTWINGSLFRVFSVNGTRTLTINTTNDKSLGANLTNNGTIDWQAGLIVFYSSPSITNNGLWNITGNNNTTYGNSSGTITNAVTGTITKSSVGTTSFTYTSPFNNSGTINFNGGTVALGGAGSTTFTNTGALAFNTGVFIVQTGTTFNYNSGSTVSGAGAFTNNATLNLNTDVVFPAPLVFASTNTINGPGNLTINNDFTIQGQVLGAGTLTINANSTWTGGSLYRAFTVESTRTMTINTATDKYLGASLTNNGTIDWQAGAIAYVNTPTITNNALWTITGNNPMQSFSSNANITNAGTITKTSNAFTTISNVTNFLNSGTINCNGGTFSVAPAFTTNLTNTGTLSFGGGAFAGGSQLTFNHNAGAIIKGTGTFTLNGTFNKNGIIAPGASPGILAMNGVQPFSGNTTINIEVLDNSGAGTGHDQITRTSSLTLDGILNVTETGTVAPGTFEIIDLTMGGILSGSFDVTNLPACYTIQQVTEPVTLTKSAPPVVSCPANSSVCITTPAYALSGGMPTGGVYTGTGVSGGNFDPATAGPGTHTITYTVTEGNMCTNTCTFDITVDAQPVADAGANQTLCNTATFTMAAVPSVGTGVWTFVGPFGTAVITSPTSATTTVTTVPTDLDITLRWTETNGTCSDDDDVVIRNDAQPVADAGANQSLCNTSTFTMAAVPSVGTGAWTFVGLFGTAVITSPTSATTTITTVPTDMNITLRWTETNGTCSDDDDVVIRNDAQPVANAGANQTLCNTATFTMAAVPSIGIGAWTFVGPFGTAVITSPTSATTTVTTVPTDMDITLSWTETNGTCSDDDDVVIRNDAQPVADAGANQTLCNTTTFTMAAVPSVGTGVWTFVGPFGTAVITSPTSATTTITTVPTDMNITLRWTETNGTCIDDDDVVIRNDAQPVADAGPDQTLCNTSTFTMAAVPSVGTGAWTFVSLFGTAVITSPTSATTTITTVPTDMNITLRWTETNGACSDDDDVLIRNDAQPVVSDQPSQALCNTSSFTMTQSVPSVGLGVWTLESGSATITDAMSPTTMVTGVLAGTSATVRWTVTNGTCSAYDDVTVTNNALPVVTCPGNSIVCIGVPAFTLTGATPAMGTYSGNGVSGGMFSPATAGAGTHTITYSYTDDNMCTNTCTFTITVTDAEINVLGLGSDIYDGDISPSLGDDTDFDQADVSVGMIEHTFTIQNIGSTSLEVPSISITGANPGDFILGALFPVSPVPALSDAYFTVTFNPTTTGLRTATVNISNSDCDESLFDFAIQGTGTSSVCLDIENLTTFETFCTIQEAIDDAETLNGHTIAIASGSYTGTMNASAKNLTFAPGNSPGCVVVGGDMTLNGGDVLAMEVNGTTACTLYDQFIVNGMVTLGGATLSLTLGYTPTIGDMLMIIDNDGTGDAIVGQFVQGAAITVGGYTFDINYAGGDGNDVVLTSCTGGVVNTNTTEIFCTIQDAIDDPQTLDGHVITVTAGTYPEHVIITKQLDIRGPNYGISGTSLSRGAEALIVPEATGFLPGDPWTEVVYINADNVSFDGFKISGDNPSLSGYAYAGMDLEKGQCVYSEGDNVTFSNNIVEKAITMGFFAGGAQVAPHYADLVVSNNKFENIHDINQLGYGFAMYIQATTGLVSNNTVENSRTGIQVQPYDIISAVTPVVTGNTFNVWRSGIYYNYAENGATAWSINSNTINAINPPVTPTGPVRWQGIAAETMRASSNGGTISGNTVNGNSLNNPLYWWTTIGLHYAGAASASTALVYSGNTASGVKYGMVHDAPADITFNGNNLTAATQAIVDTASI